MTRSEELKNNNEQVIDQNSTTTEEEENNTMTKSKAIYFARFNVTGQVFYKTKYTYALVNLKPITPGHVLIVPLRTSALHLSDLTPNESQDYMATLQKIHKFIKHIYKSDALNIAIQDGPDAGQSVPHLHAHIIPRYKGEGNIGDQVYRELEKQNYDDGMKGDEEFWKRRQAFREGGGFVVRPDGERRERGPDVMKEEALWLSNELKKYYEEEQEELENEI